ncbi:hypothetical protein RB195_009896 [Necator americanus]|uniref:Kunitz/Bovine pancreatic trypsin inhibitor domain protein n=1 Tax=Necator americanus TaxID=51031 RepID=A0ABR1CWV5_NECAM
MPLCLTFIDLKKVFDSVETEAVVEVLDNQGVPTQYIKRGIRQGYTISPKIFTATLENAMRKLVWDDMGVKVDGRQLHHLRFADDIVLIKPNISQAERKLTEFDETCRCIGLQLNLQKTMFMRNGWVSDAPFTLNGTNISECTSYVYLGRELNMMNDLTPELGRRRRVAWGAYKSIEDVVKKTRNTQLRAHLFNTTVLPALTYASETWAFRKEEENAIRNAAAFAKESKIRWAGRVMRLNDNHWTRAVSDWVPRDIKRTIGRPPTRWSDFFTKSFKENCDALRVPRERMNHWATLEPRDRGKWKNCWRSLDQFEDQRESRWYWDRIRSDCLPFTFFGQGGNFNNFQTKEHCNDFCSVDLCPVGSPLHGVSGSPTSCTSSLECPVPYSCQRGRCCPNSDSVCNQPLSEGILCIATPVTRFWFNASAGACQLFSYNGCGGNSNIFSSLDACQETCTGIEVGPYCRHGQALRKDDGKLARCGVTALGYECPINYECYHDRNADVPAWSTTSIENQEFTAVLTRLCGEAIKEGLKERRAEVLPEAAEVGESIPAMPVETSPLA